jgi:multidrug efflux pump
LGAFHFGQLPGQEPFAPDLGTTVIGGMLASTIIAIFIIPVAFYLVERMSHRKADKGEAAPVEVSIR